MTPSARWTEADWIRHRGEATQRKARPKPASQPGKPFDAFVALCVAHGLPEPETEVEFIEGRKFRADYIWRKDWPGVRRLVVERNGGIWKKGAHSSGLGLLRDYERLNLAQLADYRYLIFTPKQLDSGEALPAIRQALGL